MRAGILVALSVSAPAAHAQFVVKPYLQLGRDAQQGTAKSLTVVWHTPVEPGIWSVRYETAQGDRFATDVTFRDVRVGGIAPHRVFAAVLSGLRPGEAVKYTVRVDQKPVFSGQGVAPKAADQPYRFVAVGDTGEASVGQRRVAYQIHGQKPDWVLVTGDIVYPHGRMTEYRSRWFNIVNSDVASPSVGAPLLRSTLFVGVAGNHDIAYRNLAKYPDGLAYYPYWIQPLNGPAYRARTQGDASGLIEASGPNFPRSPNFSFDYGNAHWTVLDANYYVNWRDPGLRRWLDQDLAKARNATWRFVSFHNPPYHSSRKHEGDVNMRAITDILTKHRVDIVFNGHVHNYQRSFPMRANGNSWTIDRSFDGKTNLRPNGTIYVVTGAGGAPLYDRKLAGQPGAWKDFTARYHADYSLTVVDVNGRSLLMRQIDAQGREVDRVRILK